MENRLLKISEMYRDYSVPLNLEIVEEPHRNPTVLTRRFESHDMKASTVGDLPLFKHKPTQEEVVWKHLQIHKTISMPEAKDLYNIHRLSERIRRIRKKYRVVVKNVQHQLGKNWAVYELDMFSSRMEDRLT